MEVNIPGGLRYTREHEWLRPEDGRVGITAFAVEQLGDIVFVELPAVGTQVHKGKAFGVVESVKAVSDLYAPVSGTVTEVNATLASAPERVNADPYGEGWMIRVEIADPAEVDALLDAEAYRALIA